MELNRCKECGNRMESTEYANINGMEVMVYECPICDDPGYFFPATFSDIELMMMKGIASKGIEQELYE